MEKKKTIKANTGLFRLPKMVMILLLLGGWVGLQMANAQTPAKKAVAEYLQKNENINLENIIVSVNFEGISLDEAILRLGEISGIHFNYNAEMLSGETNVTHQAEKATLSEILTSILPSNVTFITARNFVILKEKAPVIQEDYFQETVTGTVVDAENGEPLPGVNVIVAGSEEATGSTIGTSTDMDGFYELQVPDDLNTLVFTFVGYQREEVQINERTEINIQLQKEVYSGEEVIVVGYGEQSVETVTGSYSQISGEDLDVEPTTNLTQSLKGTVPGVFGVEATGRPGQDDVDLFIRGTASLNENGPLVVIDGVPARQGGLARLNADDIKDVSVIKDASAAIYGARAANGVILVTTKRGQAGDTRFNLTYERSFNQPATIPDMADAPTFMQMLNEIDVSRGNPPRFSEEAIEEHRNCPAGSFTCFDTDWYDEGLQDWAAQNEVNASVTGGSESLRYRVSLRGLTQDGILVNSGTGFNQAGFRSNLDGNLSENVLLRFDVNGRWEERDLPSWTRGINSAWEMLQRGFPTDPAFFPNGKPGPAQENGVNPVVSNQTGFQNSESWFFQSNLNVVVDIPSVDEWSIEGTVAYDQQFNDLKQFQKPWTLYEFAGQRDENGEPVLTPVEVGVADPNLNQESSLERDILLRGQTNYETSFLGSHNTEAMFGTEYQWKEGSMLQAFRRFFPTAQIPELFAGGQEERSNSGNSFEQKRLSFFGRYNYNYQEKYLFEFVGRYEGSYIFPKGNRFGFFPNVSAGWRLANEDWFSDFTGGFFDRLKIRASWGKAGNDSVPPFQFLRGFGFANEQFAFGNGVVVPRLVQNRVPNPDITWEVGTKFDVGLDATIFNDELSFSIVYFNENRDDILISAAEAIPQTTGFSLPDQNIGRVNSNGLEAEIKYNHSFNSEFALRVGANVSWAENEIEFIAEPEGQLPWQRRTGNPMNTDLVFEADGIWNTQDEIDNADAHFPGARPGDIRFRDINGDGQINGDDRVRLDEDGIPDIIGAFNLGASIRQFDVSLQFQGATQVQRNVFTASVGEFGNYFQEWAENRWTPENTDASFPRAWNRVEPFWAANMSTFWFQDAKYLRLKTARVMYTIPVGLSQKFGVDNLRVYFTGRNLITFTPLSVRDPEISTAQTYPPSRTLTLGFRMDF